MNLEAFMDWLRAHRAPAGDLPAYQSGAEGILAIARGARVQTFHVAEAVMLARDSGLPERHLVNLLKIGNNLIRFQAEASGSLVRAPRRPTPDPAAPVAIDVDEISGLFESGPVTGAMAAVTDVPSGRAAGAAESAQARASMALSAATTESPAAPPTGKRGAGGRKAAIAGVVVLVIAGGLYFGRRFLPVAAPSATAPTPASGGTEMSLPHLGLRAEFPDGWRHSMADDESNPGPDGTQVKTSIAFRGGTAKDPDEAMFIGVLPLSGNLAKGMAVTDATLLAVAGAGQQGGAAFIAGTNAGYQSEGCAIATIGGRRTGVCRGSATRGGQSVALRTYLLVGLKRAVMAVFLAKRSGAATAATADRIVASLKL